MSQLPHVGGRMPALSDKLSRMQKQRELAEAAAAAAAVTVKTEIMDDGSSSPHYPSLPSQASSSGAAPSSSTPSTSGLQLPPSVRLPAKRKRPTSGSQEYYYRKCRLLKKIIKDLVFINAATCDEVVRTDEKIARVKEERRFLLRKLLQYQSASEAGNTSAPETPAKPAKGSATQNQDATLTPPSKGKVKKKAGGGATAQESRAGEKRKSGGTTAKEMLESLQARPKKAKGSGGRRTVPSIPLDPSGRPVFPINIGDLTIYSIGEILPDHPGFYCAEHIYPVGYCSTRVYGRIGNPSQRCLYTCKISEESNAPVFEIVAEDNLNNVVRASTPDECHSLLLQAINRTRGIDVIPTKGNGADFFGLSHPVVQNLIQSCPGARKCSGYKWVKFEVSRSETPDSVVLAPGDPTVNFDALQAVLGGTKTLSASLDQSTSLRSLLTSGSFFSKS